MNNSANRRFLVGTNIWCRDALWVRGANVVIKTANDWRDG